MRLISAIFCLLFSFSLFGNIFFDENVSEELRSKITAKYKEKNISLNFLLEMSSDKTLSIIAENGFVKTLPIDEITVDDVFNIMEEMAAEIYENQENSDENSEQLSKIKHLASKWKQEKKNGENNEKESEQNKNSQIKKGIKLAENIELFPWASKVDRFGVSIFATSEEKWAFGLKISAGLSFLRLGARFKKGINLKLAQNSVPWEAYSLNLQANIIDIYNFYFSLGFEIALYSVKNTLFDREFFIFRISYRIKWFEIATSLNLSPTQIELGLFGVSHEMKRYNFLISIGFLF